MAGGLLRVQHARERRAQAVAAAASAAVAMASGALSEAQARRRAVAEAESVRARNHWDRLSGNVVTAADLADLRGREMAGQGTLLRLDAGITLAHEALIVARHEGQLTAASAKFQAMVTLRRTRLASQCSTRLDRILARSEETALEDDREIQAVQSW